MDLNEFRNHLSDLIFRIKKDGTWFEMSWAARHHLSDLEFKFEEVISQLVKLPGRTLPHVVWVLFEGVENGYEHIHSVYSSEDKATGALRRVLGHGDIQEVGGTWFKYEQIDGVRQKNPIYFKVLKREVLQ